VIAKWENLTRDEIAAIDKQSAIVFLPTSATEQHGAHLPVGTDSIILETLIDMICSQETFDAGSLVFAPQLRIGKSNEHMGFAGTLTFGTQTYYAMLHDIAGAITKSGFRKLVLLNSPGRHTDMPNLIRRDLRIDSNIAVNIDVFVFDWWFTSFWAKGLEGLKESGKYGVFHACELETSLMLHAQPESVHMALAVDEDPVACLRDNDYVTVFGPYNAGWKTSDVTRSGVIGAPTLATAEKGKKLFDYAVKELMHIISAFARTNY